jgi:hypothetical protein
VKLILINPGKHWRQFGDLMAERLGVITLEIAATLSAMRRPAHNELTDLFRRDQDTDTTVMTGLPAPLLARRRNRRVSLHRWGIRGQRLGGVGGVRIEPFLEGGDPLLKDGDPLLRDANQRKHGYLRLRREGLPDVLWEWWAIHHATVVTKSSLKS